MKTTPFVLFATALAFLPSCTPEPAVVVNPYPVKLDKNVITFTSGDPQLKAFGTQPVTESDRIVLHLTGKLVWDEDVTTNVFSPVAGRVSSIQGSLGDKVKPGDDLAHITSPDYGQAQADAAKAQADMALAERTLERAKELLKQGVAPQKDVEIAETAFHDAELEYTRTKTRLSQWGGTLGGVNATFALKTPVGGEIVERSIHSGQEVRPDQMLAGVSEYAAPLFVISDPNRMWVMLDVTEQDLGRLKVGQELEIKPQAYGDRIFTGKLEVIGQSLDPVTRTVKVRGSVPNPEELLKSQMYASINVITATEKKPRVPLKAVFLRDGKPYVFVQKDDLTFEMRRISTVSEDAGQMLLKEGLQVGEKVVTEGALSLESVVEAATSTAE